MKFDPYAFLENRGQDGLPPAIRAIPAIPVGPNSTNSMNSMPPPAHAETAKAGVWPFTPSAPLSPSPEMFPYGLGINGTPRTWTGRVVALEEWRRLTAWERHGSTGKLWNGLTRQWEPANTS